MGILAVPDDLAHHRADGRPLLLHRHLVDAVPEHREQLPHEVELDAAQSVLGGQPFQLGDAGLQLGVLGVEFLQPFSYMDGRRAVPEVGQRVHQGVDLALGLGLLLPQVLQPLVVLLPVAGVKPFALFQLGQKGAVVAGQLLDLLHDGRVQQVAVGVAPVAEAAFAALLHLADVGVDGLAIGCEPFGELGIHPVAAAAPEQAGEQCLVAAGLAVALGFVPLERFLHFDPGFGRDEARVLPHRDDPLAGGQIDGGSPLLLVGAVVGQNAPARRRTPPASRTGLPASPQSTGRRPGRQSGKPGSAKCPVWKTG